jgi:hypothetical protein
MPEPADRVRSLTPFRLLLADRTTYRHATMTNIWFLTARLYVDLRLQASAGCRG